MKRVILVLPNEPFSKNVQLLYMLTKVSKTGGTPPFNTELSSVAESQGHSKATTPEVLAQGTR